MSSSRDETAYLMRGDMSGHHGMSSQIWKEEVEDTLQIHQNNLQALEHPNASLPQQPLKTLKKRSQDTRLSELEQQLEIAETRCDTLKQQLDYMKMLYHGVNHEPTVLEKPKKPERDKRETQRRTRSSKTSTRRPNTDSSLERKDSALASNPGCKSEQPERERDCTHSLPLVTDLSLVDAPTKEESVMPVASNQSSGGASAVQVIQDILCGITDSVNRISQLNVHINDGGNSPKEHSHRHRPSTHHHHSRDEGRGYSIEEQSPIEIFKPSPPINSCSDSNVEHIYQHEFPRIEAEKSSARKHHKPRSRGGTGKHSSGPPQFFSYPVESAESLRTTGPGKRKTSKSGNHKRSRHLGPYAQNPSTIPRPKRNIDDSMIITKLKKKRARVKAVTSRSTLGGCKKLPNRDSCNNMHLVELYHNTSARPGTSASDDNKSTFRAMHLHDSHHMGAVSEEILTVERLPSTNGPYIEQSQPQQRPCTVPAPVLNQQPFSMTIKKNFQLPTVSSKLKQVEKSYFQRFNFRNIPFVVGKSTTPSHNLGLNIQQALSIIKMRQPLCNMCPMTMAGEKPMGQNTGPYRPLSHASSRRNCPVATATMPYLPDLPDLPERDEVVDPVCGEQCAETLVAGIEPPTPRFGKLANLVRSRVTNQDLAVGGVLLEPDRRLDSIWTVDQQDEGDTEERSKMRCSCFPTRQCIDYQKLLSQYLESGEGMSFFQVVPPPTVPCYRTPYRPHLLRSTKSVATESKELPEPQPITEEIKPDNNPFLTQLKSRSRSLKEVLITLHNDFVRLNSKYNELQTGVNCDDLGEGEVMQQLEVMETELQTKEDEIAVVMALYKEVMSLKGQVRALRERTSQQSVAAFSGAGMTLQKPRRVVLREPTVSVRLMRLLRTIQQFQEKLRQE